MSSRKRPREEDAAGPAAVGTDGDAEIDESFRRLDGDLRRCVDGEAPTSSPIVSAFSEMAKLSVLYKSLLSQKAAREQDTVSARQRMHAATEKLGSAKYVLSFYDKQISEALRHTSKYSEADLDLENLNEDVREAIRVDPDAQTFTKVGEKHEIYKAKLREETERRKALRAEHDNLVIKKKGLERKVAEAIDAQNDKVKHVLAMRDSLTRLEYAYDGDLTKHMPGPILALWLCARKMAKEVPGCACAFRGNLDSLSEYRTKQQGLREGGKGAGGSKRSVLLHPFAVELSMAAAHDDNASKRTIVVHYHPDVQTAFVESDIDPDVLASTFPDDEGRKLIACLSLRKEDVKGKAPSYLTTQQILNMKAHAWVQRLCGLPESADLYAAESECDHQAICEGVRRALLDVLGRLSEALGGSAGVCGASAGEGEGGDEGEEEDGGDGAQLETGELVVDTAAAAPT